MPQFETSLKRLSVEVKTNMSVLVVCDDGEHQPPRRFVPTGRASSSEDAPGWGGILFKNEKLVDSSSSSSNHEQQHGPICWKCRCRNKKSNGNNNKNEKQCRVCHGHGRIPAKRQPKYRPGRITKARIPAIDGYSWQPSGPIPFGARRRQVHATAVVCRSSSPDDDNDDEHEHDNVNDGDYDHDYWANLVRLAEEGTDVDVSLDDDIDYEDDSRKTTTRTLPPIWAPRRGEELCRLVGCWRILQCVACHRWTTDDLLTAWVAAQEISTCICNKTTRTTQPTMAAFLNYLDLGTGNGSVLQMILWAAMKQNLTRIRALGVEARDKAVQLARRSLAFNLGTNNDINDINNNAGGKAAITARVEKGDFREYPFEKNMYDLITGTPPYFRVDFYMNNDQKSDNDNDNDQKSDGNDANSALVQGAIIQQGGMPTAKQSAPARCEFRGGIEAYCSVAAQCLKISTGKLVVCENFKNHERVQRSAAASGLTITKQVHVEGRPGRGILFVVYVMVLRHATTTTTTTTSCCISKNDTTPFETATTKQQVQEVVEEMRLTVRDDDGHWTPEYLRTVMHDMSIPAFNSHC
jgi:tRNA1(Val) A37 N6-methylase TrmN6